MHLGKALRAVSLEPQCDTGLVILDRWCEKQSISDLPLIKKDSVKKVPTYCETVFLFIYFYVVILLELHNEETAA